MNSEEFLDMQFAMKDSRRQAMIEEDIRRHSFSQGTGSGSSSGSRLGQRSSSVREASQSRRDVEDRNRRIDPSAYPSRSSGQKNIKTSFAAEGVKKMARAIGKWFLFNAIPFHAADSGPFYQIMIDTIAEVGKGVKGPTGRQISGYILEEEIEDLKKYISELNKKWPIYGCTIMCDGWSSRNKFPIVNFMVYYKGDMIFHKSVDTSKQKKNSKYIYKLMKNVVEEVGKENVVQIVTDNEAAYKAAGQKLMTKYRNIVWSPCAAHCVDLMLEDIGKIPSVASLVQDAKKITSFIYNSDQFVDLMRTFTNGRELLRPGITRFATEFIAIESLVRYQHNLKRLFTSEEWNNLSYVKVKSRRNQAKDVCELVLSGHFWKRATEVLGAIEPLVMVLKLVDQEKKPTLPVVYDAIDRAKIGIKDSKIKEWKKIWEIIDARWERQLHCDIHAAAYFLNPMSRYGKNFTLDNEVSIGLKKTIMRLEPNVTYQATALTEETIYSERRGSFGTSIAQAAIAIESPADWWNHHGEDAPHLRKIAIKVLSQTCSSSGCERNWSTFSLIHTKIRNRIAMAKLEKLVFVHYNLRLRLRSFMTKPSGDPDYCPIDLNHIFNDQDILDPWITEEEAPLIDGLENEWLNEDNQQQRSNNNDNDDDDDDDDTDDGGGGDNDNNDIVGVDTNNDISSYSAPVNDEIRGPSMYNMTYEEYYSEREKRKRAEGYYNNRDRPEQRESNDLSSGSSSYQPTGYMGYDGWSAPSYNYDWSAESSSQSDFQFDNTNATTDYFTFGHQFFDQ